MYISNLLISELNNLHGLYKYIELLILYGIILYIFQHIILFKKRKNRIKFQNIEISTTTGGPNDNEEENSKEKKKIIKYRIIFIICLATLVGLIYLYYGNDLGSAPDDISIASSDLNLSYYQDFDKSVNEGTVLDVYVDSYENSLGPENEIANLYNTWQNFIIEKEKTMRIVEIVVENESNYTKMEKSYIYKKLEHEISECERLTVRLRELCSEYNYKSER